MPRVLVSALVFGGFGSIFAFLVLNHFSPEGKDDWHSLVVCSGLAAFGVSFVLWRFFCTPHPKVSGRRGALVGALTGLITHPVAWYLAMVWMYMTGARSSLGDRTVNPFEGLLASLIYSLGSIVLVGWFTVLAGGFIGWILGRIMRSG